MILSIRWHPQDETRLYGDFTDEQIAFAFVNAMRARRGDAHPHEALILEPNPCPGRKGYEVLYRYVKGEWK